jgi:hypothetical protein
MSLRQSSAKKDALRRDPNYAKYIHHLVSAGYFKGELEGSQLWNALEDKAVTAFIDAHREEYARLLCVTALRENLIRSIE